MADLVDARIVGLEAQPTLVVRVQQPMGELDLGSVFEQQLPRIFARIQEAGGHPAGPPFGRYHQFGPDIVDVEAGFPVSAAIDGVPPLADVPAGELGMSTLPAGRTATATHLGPYDGLPGAYDQLHDWIHGQGHDEGAGPWEVYASDPAEAADPSEIRTDLFWPIGS